MKVTKSSPLVLALLLACTPSAPAQLPSIDKKPWENYFIVLKNRKFQFGITTEGEAVFYPLSKRGEIISESNPIIFKIEILEAKSDGDFTSKKINIQSLKSDQQAALNPEKPVTFSGSVTGDATFEVTITPDKQGFSITGKITGKGKLTQPLSLGIEMWLRPYAKDKTRSPEETKSFNQRVKRDKFEVVIGKGKTKSYDFKDNANIFMDLRDGVESLSMKADGYEFTEFTVTASGSEKIRFPDKNQIVGDGVDFKWLVPSNADPAKDFLKITAK